MTTSCASACRAGQVPPAGCTRIGRVEAGSGVDCGLDIDIAAGYQHF